MLLIQKMVLTLLAVALIPVFLVASLFYFTAPSSFKGFGDIFLVALFILSVAIIFVAFYLARRINEPILGLSVAADKMRDGDLSARAKVGTKDKDEIGQLASTFNAMAENVERVDEMKSEFVLLASHQLRTPATAVKGFISMLLDGYAGKLDGKNRKMLKAAFEENERQISVINSILDVARLESGELSLVRETQDIGAIIEASAAGQIPILAAQDQKITVKKPKQPVKISVDGEKLRLVLDNLIHNASKYSDRGKHITIELKSDAGHVYISVTDEGIGIAQADLPRLFKRFSRISSPQTAGIQGAGVGLYLAERLVKMHKGQIHVQSQPGKGTTFTIELPNIKEEPKNAADSSS